MIEQHDCLLGFIDSYSNIKAAKCRVCAKTVLDYIIETPDGEIETLANALIPVDPHKCPNFHQFYLCKQAGYITDQDYGLDWRMVLRDVKKTLAAPFICDDRNFLADPFCQRAYLLDTKKHELKFYCNREDGKGAEMGKSYDFDQIREQGSQVISLDMQKVEDIEKARCWLDHIKPIKVHGKLLIMPRRDLAEIWIMKKEGFSWDNKHGCWSKRYKKKRPAS